MNPSKHLLTFGIRIMAEHDFFSLRTYVILLDISSIAREQNLRSSDLKEKINNQSKHSLNKKLQFMTPHFMVLDQTISSYTQLN